jgi:nucleotide-binding universal stress UspA family protein
VQAKLANRQRVVFTETALFRFAGFSSRRHPVQMHTCLRKSLQEHSLNNTEHHMFYHPKMISGFNDAIASPEEHTDQVSSRPAQTVQSRPPAVHRTLIPVEESESASRAIEYVIRSARFGSMSEVHLINVQPEIMQGDFAWNDVVEAEKRTRLAAGKTAIERARKLLDDNKIACKMAIRFGRTAKTIVQYASEEGIDAIVMGMRSRGPVARLLRRSVAAQVARMADVPVMILNSGTPSRGSLGGNSLDGLRPVLMN